MTSDRPPAMIALDWGTSSLRAYLLDSRGRALASKRAEKGVMQVEQGGFAAVFDEITGPWRQRWPDVPAIAAGMIGSSEGWVQAPYVPCPAGLGELAAALTVVPEVNLVVMPGVVQTGEAANLMRGEEAQIVGALALQPELQASARLVLPGTHSKWVDVTDGRIMAFTTYMTGELFAVLRNHSILGRYARAGTPDPATGRAAFLRGVDAARGSEGIAPLLFSARAKVLIGALAPEESLDYLSGLLIGDELRSALAEPARSLVLIGDPSLCERYALALARFGISDVDAVEEAAIAGFWRTALAAGLVNDEAKEDL